MKTRNFSVTLTGSWQSLTSVPTYIQGLQLENPSGNDTVQYRSSEGVARDIEALDVADFKAIDNEDPLRNEFEVKGTAAQTLYGEYWCDNDQVD